MKKKVLTRAQTENYERDGFLVIENFIPSDDCDLLMERAQQLIAAFDPEEAKIIFSTLDARHAKNKYFFDSGDKIRFFFEENALNEKGDLTREKALCINKIGHALHDVDPVFNTFSRTQRLATLANDLCINNPLLVQSMYICKQPQIGGLVTCHQDQTYLFAEKPVTGFWFALETSTIENGCLWAIPGGHRTALKSRMIRDMNDNIEIKIFDDSEWPLEKMQPLEVSRGSLIVLHGLLPHMSYENKSPHSRHAYTLHVMSGDCEYAMDNWLQRPKAFPFRGFDKACHPC